MTRSTRTAFLWLNLGAVLLVAFSGLLAHKLSGSDGYGWEKINFRFPIFDTATILLTWFLVTRQPLPITDRVRACQLFVLPIVILYPGGWLAEFLLIKRFGIHWAMPAVPANSYLVLFLIACACQVGLVYWYLPEEGVIQIFISHSSKDAVLAKKIIDLIRSALQMPPESIRCTSVDGYGLPPGLDFNEKLRREVREAMVLIGLLTPESLRSTYVLFELGARWGANKSLIPLFGKGLTRASVDDPLRTLSHLNCADSGQMLELVKYLADLLNRSGSLQDKLAYDPFIADVVAEGAAAPS